MAVRWLTGVLKKPWIWPWCRSMVMVRSTPAASIRFATSFAVMGSRDAALRSWREYT